MFLYAAKRGQIDGALGMAFMAHHLIKFTREALSGEQNASFYSTKAREAEEEWRGNRSQRSTRLDLGRAFGSRDR